MLSYKGRIYRMSECKGSLEVLVKEFDINDKEKFEAIRRKYEYNTAAYSFASFYIWKDTLNFKLYMEDDLYSVWCGKYGNNVWTFPCGSKENRIEFISSKIIEKDFAMIYLRKEDKAFLDEHFPGMFEIEEKLDCNEYIYDRDAWEALEGKKYGAMRNHIRRANKDNVLRVEKITCDNVDKVYEIIESWDSSREDVGSLGDTDKEATTLLIRNYRNFEEKGIVVYVNEEPYAVVAGFPISDTMFDMCLAKQKSILPGLSVYAKYMFVANLPKEYKIINAEDDLGIEGLRNMKRQMQPIGQIEIFFAKKM